MTLPRQPPFRRRVRALLAVCATGVALQLGATAVATPSDAIGLTDDQSFTASPEWTYQPGVDQFVEEDVAARAETENVSLDEARRRFRTEHAAPQLEAEAAARWPSTYGGVWITHDPFVVNVAFTEDAEANVASMAEDFPYPSDLAPATVEMSLTELEQLQQAATGDRAALQSGRVPNDMPEVLAATSGTFDVEIDVPENQVVLRAANDIAALDRAVKHRYGPAARARRGIASPASCAQADCRHAMVGGIKLLQIDGTYCSAGFTGAAGSDRFMISAGHCWEDTRNQARYNGGATMSYVDAYKVGDNVDAERSIRAIGTPWRATSKFFVEGEDPRFVTSWRTYGDQTIGAYIGKTGATTGTTRGYIDSKTVSVSYIPGSYNFIRADFCVSRGDSGGAVWQGNTAFGIVSGVFKDTFCRGGGWGAGIYGAIGPAMKALNVNLLGGNVNLPPTAAWSHTCTMLGSCTFDARGSNDEDGSIRSYRWTFNDGTSASGATFTRTFLPGPYSGTLTITDNNGTSHTVTRSFLVL